MSPAARSIHIFGIYLVVLGIVLLAAPNLLLSLFRLPLTTEVWLRVVGMLVAFLGIQYRVAAAAEFIPFFLTTVLLRASVPLFFLVFVMAGWTEWPLLCFGVIDAAGAAWTWKALHSRGATA
jgi:hypothetical protein